jgi:hypothetical protein
MLFGSPALYRKIINLFCILLLYPLCTVCNTDMAFLKDAELKYIALYSNETLCARLTISVNSYEEQIEI